MTKWEDLPQWARDKAVAVQDAVIEECKEERLAYMLPTVNGKATLDLFLARALIEAKNSALEEAASLCESHVEEVRRGNVRVLGDIPEGLNSNHAGQTYASAIRKMKEEP
jgi:hypothetical protein